MYMAWGAESLLHVHTVCPPTLTNQQLCFLLEGNQASYISLQSHWDEISIVCSGTSEQGTLNSFVPCGEVVPISEVK